MSDIARAMIAGRLTRDPELHPAGKVLSFSVAVGQYVKDGDDTVSYLDVKVLGTRAQGLASFLSKGMQVAVDARIVQERWTDKETGKGRSAVRFIADEVVVSGGRGNEVNVPVSDFPADDPNPFLEQPADASIPFRWDGAPSYEQRRDHRSRR